MALQTNLTSWEALDAFLHTGGKPVKVKKVGHNTYAHRVSARTIAIEYYGTPVVTYQIENRIHLNPFGWLTTCTLRRMRAFTPASLQPFIENFIGYVRWNREGWLDVPLGAGVTFVQANGQWVPRELPSELLQPTVPTIGHPGLDFLLDRYCRRVVTGHLKPSRRCGACLAQNRLELDDHLAGHLLAYELPRDLCQAAGLEDFGVILHPIARRRMSNLACALLRHYFASQLASHREVDTA